MTTLIKLAFAAAATAAIYAGWVAGRGSATPPPAAPPPARPFQRLQSLQPGGGLVLTVTGAARNPNGSVTLTGTVTGNPSLAGLTVYTPFVSPPPQPGPTSNGWHVLEQDGRWQITYWPTVQQAVTTDVEVADWNGAKTRVTVPTP